MAKHYSKVVEPVIAPAYCVSVSICSVFFPTLLVLSLFSKLFIYWYFWLYWVFVALAGCSPVGCSGLLSGCSNWGGFSCCRAQLQLAQASGVVRGLSSCGSRALERAWVVVARGLSCPVAVPSSWTRLKLSLCIARRILNHWTTREALVLSLVLTI